MYPRTSRYLALIGLASGFLLAMPTNAQLIRGHCDCDAITPAQGASYVTSEEKAIRMVDSLLIDVKRHARLRFNETIQVKETNCPTPSALICGIRLGGRVLRTERLIIYNNVYLNRISRVKGPQTWIDWHVLSHEIGHHVLGHLDGGKPIIPLEKLYEQETAGKKTLKKQYAIDGLQAREFEADFFGLWLLSRTRERFSFPSFINSFDTTFIHSAELELQKAGAQQNKGNGNRQMTAASASHPFFQDRLWAMKQFWSKLNIETTTLAKASYFADAANAAYIELHSERAFWDLGFVAGLTATGKPVFTANGQPVDGLLYPVRDAYNLYAGLTVSRFAWFSPWRYEAEIAFSKQTYGTTIEDGNAKRLLESLEFRWITLFPKITWSPIGARNTKFVSNRFGAFVSIGPMVRWPLRIDYQNYGLNVPSANLPSLQPSVSPRLSIGVEVLKKTLLPRAYKLAVSYEPTWIRLNTTPQPRAISHNLDVTLYYSFLRW